MVGKEAVAANGNKIEEMSLQLQENLQRTGCIAGGY